MHGDDLQDLLKTKHHSLTPTHLNLVRPRPRPRGPTWAEDGHGLRRLRGVLPGLLRLRLPLLPIPVYRVRQRRVHMCVRVREGVWLGVCRYVCPCIA